MMADNSGGALGHHNVIYRSAPVHAATLAQPAAGADADALKDLRPAGPDTVSACARSRMFDYVYTDHSNHAQYTIKMYAKMALFPLILTGPFFSKLEI